MRFLFSWLVYSVSLFVSAQELPSQFSQLRIITEDYPPLNYLEEGQLTGASVEILKLVYQELEVPLPEIEVMPWARAYHLAQSEQPIMLFTMSRTAARETLFQWAGHTHASRTYLVTFEGSGIDQYNPRDQTHERVLAIKSDVTQYAIEELGYPTEKLDLVDSNQTMFKILTARRTLLMSVADSPFNTAKKSETYRDFPFKVLDITRESQGYFAFSKGVDTAFVEAFQRALDSIRPEQKVILMKYGMIY